MEHEATLNAEISGIGRTDTDIWFEYGKEKSYGESTEKRVKNTTGKFAFTVSGLDADTLYYFRAMAENSHGRAYGKRMSFTTKPAKPGTAQEPVETTAANAGKNSNEPVTVQLECADVAEACGRTYYRIDKGLWQEGTSIELLDDGNYIIEFYSESAGGSNEKISETWALVDTVKPETVSGFRAVKAGGGIRLEWQAPEGEEGAGFVVYRNGELYAETAGLEFLDSDIAPGLTYEYSVSVVDLAGNESDKSDLMEVSIERLPEQVEMEFILPKEGAFLLAENIIETIEVRLSSGGSVIEKDLKARVVVNGIEEDAVLIYSPAKGTHAYSLKQPIAPGKGTLKIEIEEEDFAGSRTVSFEFGVDMTGFLVLVGVVVVLVAVVGGAVFFLYRKGKMKLPKRGVPGKAKKQKEKPRFLPQEERAIRTLVKELKPKAGFVPKKEVYKAIRRQGFSMKIAHAALKRLYK